MFELAEIDRGIFEAIRLVLVNAGYLPNRATVGSVGAFNTAKQAIIASGKEVIEVFGVGNYKDRQDIKNNKIVIDRTGGRLGSIGGMGNTYFEQTATDVFDEYAYPSQTRDIDYQITYICSSTKYDRILNGLITSVIYEKGFLKGIKADGTPTADAFHYSLDDEKDNSDGEYIERVFRLTVNEVFVGLPRKVNEGVVTVKHIGIEIKAGKDLANADTANTLNIDFEN